MTPIIQLFLALGLVIIIAKAFGYLSMRLNQPAILGELIAGVLLGPSILNIFHNASLFPDGELIEETVLHLAEIGVLLLMFLAGMEIDLQAMRKVGRTAVAAGVLGVIAPILLITPSALAFGSSFNVSLFIGLILAATSVSISAQVMLDLGVLSTKEGLGLLGAAVVDDILVVLLISIFIAVNPANAAAAEEGRSVLEVIVRLVGFLVIATGLGLWFLPRIAKLIKRTPISEGVLTVAVVSALVFGFSAEFFGGVAAITGSFLAGLCLGRADRQIAQEIDEGLHRINYSFFVPIFFVSIGLQADFRLLGATVLPLALVLAVAAIVSKIVGPGLGGLLTGFDRRSSLRLGIGMISRGEVGLIVASLGLASGIINAELYAAVVFVVLVTTIVTPPLVHWSFRDREQRSTEASS